MSTAWFVLAALMVLVGLLGTVLPALPGVPLIFLGLLLAAWADGFAHVGGWAIAVLAVLTVVSLLVDLWATLVGAKRVGASGKALVGSVVGTFAGLPFGIVGLLVGPFLGAVAGELLHQRRRGAAAFGPAARVGVGTWIGIAIGIAAKLGIAVAMLGVFAFSWWL